ncbi:MAG: hypothetical protein V9E98_10480 [Candidatus Nanopelagicales bacterium]
MKSQVMIACSTFAGFALAVVATPAVAAPAAPTQTTDTIKVCVKKKSGAMRSVQSKKSCHKGERFLKLQATSGTTLRNVHVININCNMSAVAGSTSATAGQPQVQTVTVPDGTTTLVVTCGDSATAS